MKNNIFQIVVIGVFFIVFGYFFGDRYWEYHKESQEYISSQAEIQEAVGEFSFEKISQISGTQELYVLPNISLLYDIVQHIDAAKSRVYIMAYIFTEREIRDAVIRAHQRGIDIQVLMENNPYKATYLNDNHYDMLYEAGIDVRWSDPLHYSLNHAKYMLIDQQAYISTGNFSYSLFTKNRDFIFTTNDSSLAQELGQLFEKDYNAQPGGILSDTLVISPDTSRKKLTYMLRSAQESIDFYFPYMQDDDFTNELFESAQRGIDIRGVTSKTFFYENTQYIQEMKAQNINISFLQSPKLHAKSILIDKKYLYIGSINFSRYSFDENRELGIIITDPEIINKFLVVFESDL